MTADLRHHGDGELAPGLLDFAVNVALPGPPEWLAELLRASVDQLGSYPDPGPAAVAVAARHGRPVNEVLLTAGAAEAFVLIARACRPRLAVCVHPSFTEPEAALRGAGHRVERLVLSPPYGIADAHVPDQADLVVLGNPTNPTGVLHEPAAVAALARPGRVLVVDEAFADTVPGEAGSLAGARNLPGLVVVRSLTKTWGLAGLRVGYLLAPAELRDRLASAQPPWPVSTPALLALCACVSPRALAEAEATARALTVRRERLVAKLASLAPLRLAAASSTSFLLLEVADGAQVRERLRELGLAVRRGETFPGLSSDHLRVAVRDEAANDRLLAALAHALAGRRGVQASPGCRVQASPGRRVPA